MDRTAARGWRLRVVGASLGCGVLIGLAVALAFRGRDPPPSPLRGPNFPPALRAAHFSLTDQEGRPASLREYRGEVVVIAFLSTSCPTPCRAVAGDLDAALVQAGHRTPALAVSVDPSRDTPVRARALLRRLGMRGRMRFLLGTEAALRPVWRSYGLAPDQVGRPGTAFVIVVDRAGRLRVGYPPARLKAPDLAHDIAVLSRERLTVAS